MDREIPVNFGHVKYTSNSNIKLIGETNKGNIQNNSNLLLQSKNGTLNLISNINAKLNLFNTKIKAVNTSNAQISGSDNIFDFEKDSNLKFSGNKNNLKLHSNSNVRFDGNDGNIKLTGNTNTKVDGDNNRVTAINNLNLKISGDDNKVNIADTKNHHLKCVKQISTEKANVVQIIPIPKSPSLLPTIMGFSFGQKCSIQYSVDYIKEAVIKKNDYNVGIFQFNMVDTGNQVRIRINDTNFDSGSFQVTQTAPDTVILTASQHGEKQSLKILGPTITTQTCQGPSTLLVNLVAAAGI